MAFSVLRCVMIGSTSNHFCNNQGMALEISFYLVKLQQDRERSRCGVVTFLAGSSEFDLEMWHLQCKQVSSRERCQITKVGLYLQETGRYKENKVYGWRETPDVCILKRLYPKTALFFESVCGLWVGLITTCILILWRALQSCDKHGKRWLLPWNVLFPSLYHSHAAGSCFLKKRSLKRGLTYL